MENNLIDFDDLLVQPIIQSKWEIENNERNILIEFIESKIISQVKNMFEEKDKIIYELLEKQRITEHKIDKLTFSLEKKNEQINSLVATINANNEQNEYFKNELKEKETNNEIQFSTIIYDIQCDLLEKQRITEHKIDKLTFSLEKKDEQIHSLVATINANNEQNEYFRNELKEKETNNEIQFSTIIDDIQCFVEKTNDKISKIENKLEKTIDKNRHVYLQNKLLVDDLKKLDIKSEWIRLQFNYERGFGPGHNKYENYVKFYDFPEYYPSALYGKKIKNQNIITEEQYYELDGLIILVAIKRENIIDHNGFIIDTYESQIPLSMYDKNILPIKKYLDYEYDTLILPLPISKNNTFEDAMKIKEDIEKLGGIVQIV
jgi:3-deoxy-D-manno-octulosonate 8-phosphate phosphatase KdsC-like HAD superfamily phosphatase